MRSPGKILIINPFGIGDVLFTMPLIASISKSMPGCRIGYLCNRRTEPILKADPRIEWVFVYEKDELRNARRKSLIGYLRALISFVSDIRSKGFDASIDLSLNREYGVISLLAGIKERIGYNYRGRGAYLTKRTDIDGYRDRHIVEYYLDLLKYLGISVREKDAAVNIPDNKKLWARKFLSDYGVGAGDLVVGIAPAGGASWGRDAGIKHWRSGAFAMLADRLADEMKARIILFGSEPEAGICEGIKAAMRNAPIMACGKTDILDAAALMGFCRAVIANDGGPLHLAAGAGAATVGIFGPVDEKVYGQYPPGTPKHRVVKAELECRPCYRDFRMKDCAERACLEKVDPDAVYAAVKEVISQS